jgi:hypothetical protein
MRQKKEAWTPDSGFARRKPSKSAAQRRQEDIEAMVRLKEERLAKRSQPEAEAKSSAPKPRPEPQAPASAKTPSPAPKKIKRKSEPTTPRRKWGRGDCFFAKQIREKTPMVFHGYDGAVYSGRVLSFFTFALLLQLADEKKRKPRKRDLCYYTSRC